MKTCQDLLGKSKSPDYYEKLRMAGLVRHLIVGPRSLRAWSTVSPSCRSSSGSVSQDATAWQGPMGFDASRRERPAAWCSARAGEAFLASRVVHCHQWLSVEQLLTTVAHAYGGFLSDVPHGLSREAIVAVDVAIQEGGAGPISIALQEMTGVVLRALIPANPSGEPKPRVRPEPTAAAAAAPGCPFSGKLPT